LSYPLPWHIDPDTLDPFGYKKPTREIPEGCTESPDGQFVGYHSDIKYDEHKEEIKVCDDGSRLFGVEIVF
jgi:hypothetical protein